MRDCTTLIKICSVSFHLYIHVVGSSMIALTTNVLLRVYHETKYCVFKAKIMVYLRYLNINTCFHNWSRFFLKYVGNDGLKVFLANWHENQRTCNNILIV